MSSRVYRLPVKTLYSLIIESGVTVESIYDGQDIVRINSSEEFIDTALSVDACCVKVTYGGEFGTWDLVFWGAAPCEIISDYCSPEDSELSEKMDLIHDKFVMLFEG
jgi:hypothetical protein